MNINIGILCVCLVILYALYLYALYIIKRNQKVHDFSIYLTELIYINNIFNIATNNRSLFDHQKVIPEYNVLLYSFKQISFKKPKGFKLFSEFTEQDLELLFDPNLSGETDDHLKKAVKHVKEYESHAFFTVG